MSPVQCRRWARSACTPASARVATNVVSQLPEAVEAISVNGITLVERHRFLVAHSEPGGVLPEEVFDHRLDGEARAERLSGSS